MGRWLWVLGLVLLLQACNTLGATPPQSVIERGLAVKMAQTQQALIIHLAPKVPHLPNLTLRQVEVTLRESQDNDIFHIQGTYQAVIQLTNREDNEAGPFDLYLAREKMEDTVSWFLISDDKRELLVTTPS